METTKLERQKPVTSTKGLFTVYPSHLYTGAGGMLLGVFITLTFAWPLTQHPGASMTCKDSEIKIIEQSLYRVDLTCVPGNSMLVSGNPLAGNMKIKRPKLHKGK